MKDAKFVISFYGLEYKRIRLIAQENRITYTMIYNIFGVEWDDRSLDRTFEL